MGAPHLAPEVEAELDDIWLYIARRSGNIEIAERFIGRITDTFQLVADNPYIGRRRDADLRPGLRSFPVGQYLIIYKVEDGKALILHVVHGRRNLEALFGE